MIFIVGLGNPGDKYQKTPHNAGFRFVEQLHNTFLTDPSYITKQWELKDKFDAWIAEVRKGDEKIFLVKPNTFMNLSGEAVRKLYNWYRDEQSKKLVVAFDELDLQNGEYKIAIGKYSKSHNGVSSIVAKTGIVDFLSVRIGVETRPEGSQMAGKDYVLSSFDEEKLQNEEKAAKDAIISLRTNFSEYLA